MDPSPKQNSPFSSNRFQAAAGHVLVIVSALFTTRITLLIPRLSEDFKDSPFPLPALSLLVMRFYPVLLVVACGTVLVTLYLAWRYRSNSPPLRIMVPLILCLAAQALLVGGAMILPAVKFMNGYVAP